MRNERSGIPTLDTTITSTSAGPISSGPTLSIVQFPEQVDVVEGLAANVDVVMSGGAAVNLADPNNGFMAYTNFTVPTRTNRAIIDWERSDDSGASWRVIAHSYQNEANSLPAGVGYAWRYWGIRHGFVATAADQGALLRFQACYTPPAPTEAPPCIIQRDIADQRSAAKRVADDCRCAPLGARPHGPDRQPVGDRLRPARPHAAVADTSCQFQRRLEQCHHRYRCDHR